MRIEPASLKQLIAYVFWGFCTTILNVVCFYMIRLWTPVPLAAANLAAWFVSVCFAFIVNRRYVFTVPARYTFLPAGQFLFFLLSRIFSGVLDIGLMEILVHWADIHELTAKIAVNVAVVIVNYLTGKFLVFSGAKQ